MAGIEVSPLIQHDATIIYREIYAFAKSIAKKRGRTFDEHVGIEIITEFIKQPLTWNSRDPVLYHLEYAASAHELRKGRSNNPTLGFETTTLKNFMRMINLLSTIGCTFNFCWICKLAMCNNTIYYHGNAVKRIKVVCDKCEYALIDAQSAIAHAVNTADRYASYDASMFLRVFFDYCVLFDKTQQARILSSPRFR